MVGFGFASQTGFESATGVKTANSSGEHVISFMSPSGTATRGRLCANADVDQTVRAKKATTIRGNSFRKAIDRELPSRNLNSSFWYF